MASYELTVSEMQEVANAMRTKTDELQKEATQTYQAAETLSEGWQGDAYEEFRSNMSDLNTWMNEMVTILNDFAGALDTAAENYQTTDEDAAKLFKK